MGSLNEEADETGGSDATQGALATVALPWARYVTGVDQALEELRGEADERLRQEQQPSKPAMPGPTILDRDAGARQPDVATSPEQAASRAIRPSEPRPDRTRPVRRGDGLPRG